MALKYTTALGFWKFLGIKKSVLDFLPGDTPSKEIVASSPVTAGDYYLDLLGVEPSSLKLYSGTTELTETTDYTFDSDSSKITITASGEAALSGEALNADYDYNEIGKDLSYNETVILLEQSEKKLESMTNVVFADQSSSSPNYLQITDEFLSGKGVNDNLYSTEHYPIIKLSTTTSGTYTTGDTELVLSSGSGFPSSGTIYIGGNKVTYSSLNSNTLTVPSSTPSIDDGAIVRGEVVEVSTSPSGVSPTYTALTPDADYTIDYDTGRIQLMDEYYFVTDTIYEQPPDGVTDRLKLSYNHAFHEIGQDATIPDDIEMSVYMIAGRQLVQRTVLKSLACQRDNFTPQSFGFSKTDIEETLKPYIMTRNSNI